ncbi:MAG TPA: DUF58 domain-containing protein [Pyrinomonadaceae bacterium]|jgi:uncharacterized protein (DUF58 family)|nr:DUF58 domain-containing protein [Pyrinomonadaceae bacterium]
MKNFRRWRNAILGTTLVLAGALTALLTVFAQRRDDMTLTSVASIASLIIAALLLILVVPPLARSARAEVRQLDVPLGITRGGMIYLGILAVVAFAALNTGNNLLFLVLSLLISALIVSWGAARMGLRDLVVSARFPDHIFAGEPAPVIVTLRNRKRFLPSFSILVEARGPIDDDEMKAQRKGSVRRRFAKRSLAYFMYVPHRAAAEQRTDHLFDQRGHVLITGFELSTRFPFGFFRRRRRLPARNVDIIVYPKLKTIGDELHLLPMNAGRLASVRRGAGHDLLSLRDYQPQDDLRHIDWKSTARSRRLTVREFTAEDERRVTIALDTRARSGEGQLKEKDFAARFEAGVTTAASLVAHFIAERAEVRLVLGLDGGRYGVGPEQLYDCLRRLALVTPQTVEAEISTTADDWQEVDWSNVGMDGHYGIFVTTAAPGSIPSHVWRSSHVIYY